MEKKKEEKEEKKKKGLCWYSLWMRNLLFVDMGGGPICECAKSEPGFESRIQVGLFRATIWSHYVEKDP